MFPTQMIKIRLNTNTNSSDTHPLPKRKPRAKRELWLFWQAPVKRVVCRSCYPDGRRNPLPVK